MVDLGRTAEGVGVALNLEKFIGSHGCVVANSGGGKSGLLRKLLESTHGQVQQIVLDVEDEYYTLRERFDYVIAGGEGADVPAPLANAGQLARATLENGFSAIVQLNDLGESAAEYIADFIGGLMSAPRALWRPVMIVFDEAQRIVPGKNATAANGPVRDLLFRGRKRGFTALLASLRLADAIDPTIRGMVNNWMLGRVGQALDRNAMADQLGFTAKEGREKLRGVAERHFWGFGPAIASEPVLFRVDDTETTVVKAGQAKVPTPPAPEAMRKILAALAKAPAATVADEQPGKPAAPGPDRQPEIDAMEKRALTAEQLVAGMVMASEQFEAAFKQAGEAWGMFEAYRFGATQHLEANGWEKPAVEEIAPAPPEPSPVITVTKGKQVDEKPADAPAASPPSSIGGAGKSLAIVAGLYPNGINRETLALRAGINARGSTMSSYLSLLRTAGFVRVAEGAIFATEEGVAAAGPGVELPPDPGPELARWWAKKLGSVGPMVEELIASFPDWLQKTELGEKLAINPKGSTLSSYLSKLRTAKLIEESCGDVRLSASVMKG